MVKIQRHDSLSISQAEEALSIWSRRTSKPKAGNSLSLSLLDFGRDPGRSTKVGLDKIGALCHADTFKLGQAFPVHLTACPAIFPGRNEE